MEGIELSEIELLEREILRLAKEIDLEEKHVQRFFDGTYTGTSLTRHVKGKRVVLLAQAPDNATGKFNYPIIKSTGENNHEIISKMEKLMKLFRVYRAFKKAEEMKAKAREDLAVLAS